MKNTEHIAQRLQTCLPRLTPRWRGDMPLASLGLDSMDTVELLCVIHQEFGVRFTETEFHPAQTVNGLLTVIADKSGAVPSTSTSSFDDLLS